MSSDGENGNLGALLGCSKENLTESRTGFESGEQPSELEGTGDGLEMVPRDIDDDFLESDLQECVNLN